MRKRGSIRGQVTIFIIIAIFIVALGITFYIFREDIGGKTNSNIAPVITFVQDCIDKTFEESIYAVARNGGYSGYNYIEKTNEDGITYYLIDEKNYMPSKDRIELEIAEYFNNKLFLCTQHFIAFNDYQIEEGNLETTIDIEEEKIFLEMNYPLAIKKDKERTIVKNFESELEIPFLKVYNSVQNFILQQEPIKNSICLNCFQMANNEDIQVDVENFYNGETIFTFMYNSSELNNKTLTWVFANKY